jgi:hypothetical protein
MSENKGDFFGALCAEYEAWLKANNLPALSADELIFEDGVTKKQREWLADFSNRWEDAAEEERKSFK